MVDFMYIGASRAGSTWTYKWLVEHPEVVFPFGKTPRVWNKKYPDFLKAYKKGMAGAKKTHPNKKIGDYTDGYTQIPLERIYEIKELYPDVRVLYCIRNPMLITLSHLSIKNYQDSVMPGDRAEKAIKNRDEVQLKYGNYMRNNIDFVGNIKRWSSVFSNEQVLPYFYDDIHQPRKFLGNISKHIGISETFWDTISLEQLNIRLNKTKRRQLQIEKQNIEYLIEFSKPNIEALEDYFNRDFSYWYDEVWKKHG